MPEASGIIAEFKRRSPSRPQINLMADVLSVTQGYERAGASALSVLTDEKFFGGSDRHIQKIRSEITVPILRKDFTIDRYQIREAKSIGADLILLIAAILTPEQTQAFTTEAHDLGLEVLLEVHEAADLDHLKAPVDLVGINNRNLRTFEVDLQHSIALADRLPRNLPRISESGLSDPKTVIQLREKGFDGFLMGEHFMKQEDPAAACQHFIAQIQK